MNKNQLLISRGTYGSNKHACLWMLKVIDGIKQSFPEYALLYEMDFEYFYNTSIKWYVENGWEVKFVKEF